MTAMTRPDANPMPAQLSAPRALTGRRPGRGVGVLLAAIVIAAGTYLTAVLGSGGPSTPATTPVPVLPVPGDIAPLAAGGDQAAGPTADGRLPIADRLAFWTGRVQANPGDFLSFVQLALVEAEGARLTVDLDGYQRALVHIDRSLAIVPAYPPTIRARGSIRFALHDFRGALADAEQVLAVAPTDAAALALHGDALVELGRPGDAVADYDRLAVSSPGPWLDVRQARLASVNGEASRAVSLARKALAGASTGDPAEIGFYAYALGEYARLAGDAATARSGFETALDARPTDVGALIGLARIDAFEGRLDAAISGLRRATAIVPQPEALALLGDLEVAQGDAGAADATFRTVRFIGDLGAVEGAVYDRQVIRFDLDHGAATPASLEAAVTSLAAQPDSAGHDLLAWALYRLGRVDDAALEIGAARAMGANDARLRFHDGAIALALGDAGRGRELLQSALDDGPALDPTERAEAVRLMRP